MAKVQVESTIFDNKKILKLAKLTKWDPLTAVARMIALWAWALEAGREDGSIADLPEGRTAVIMRCAMPDKKLVGYLKEADLLDSNGCIHNWRKRTRRYFDEKRRGEERRESGYWKERKGRESADGTAGATEVPPISLSPIRSNPSREEGGGGGGADVGLFERFKRRGGNGTEKQFGEMVYACDIAKIARERIAECIDASGPLDVFALRKKLMAAAEKGGNGQAGPARHPATCRCKGTNLIDVETERGAEVAPCPGPGKE